MRWSYLIPRLILVAVVWACTAFGLDPLLRYSTVKTTQAMIGAKADVRELRSELFPPQLTIDGVALASAKRPGTNLLSFDKLQLKLAGDPLLHRSFVVDEASMTGVRFGTSRNDSGLLDPRSEPEPAEPSWLTERLRSLGDEWLDDVTAQLKGQVDPNVLETYRVGNELYAKWDAAFNEMKVRIESYKPRIDDIRKRIDTAKHAEPLQQIDIYLNVARKSDQLLQEGQLMQQEIQAVTPIVRQDFQRLDQARLNDQQMVVQKVRLLKPDGRRISESLIGKELYLQLQQLLSWLETARQYQQDLKQQAKPERGRGRDFEFELFNPTPRLLCRKLKMTGEISLGNHLVPFHAVLANVTSNPKLLGQPAVLNLQTAGRQPARITVAYDATKDTPQTHILADYADADGRRISIGRENRGHLTAKLQDVRWNAKLLLINNDVQGELVLASNLSNSQWTGDPDHPPEFAIAIRQMMANIATVNATVKLSGTTRKPEISIDSDFGQQIADGFQHALTVQLQHLRTRLVAKVDEMVIEQRTRLATKLGSRYQTLLNDNTQILGQIQQTQQVVASLRSGRIDPNQVFRQVSESGVLSERDQQKTQKTLDKANRVLDGMRNPNDALQKALPGLRDKLFR